MARVKGSGESHRRLDKSRKRMMRGPEPIIRVSVMEEFDRIDLMLDGEYRVEDLDGNLLKSRLKSGEKWHVAPDKTIEARAVYGILLTAFARRDSADHLRKSFAEVEPPVRVVEVGEEIYIDERLVANNLKYRVVVGRWQTEREAIDHIDEYRDHYAPRVVRQITRPAGGSMELYDNSLEDITTIEDGFRLIPASEGSRVTLYDVREGTGFHWEREVDRSYPGIIEMRVDHRALLMALVELPIELYLKGVVPAEMPPAYPIEALKAQAIAARSEVLAKIGVKHINDPFDLCATVHCQVYSGSTHEHERTSQAVDETRGQMILIDGRVAEAVFSACSGGHTEDKLNVWNPPDAPHLKGRWDAPKGADIPDTLDLTTEAGVTLWVTMRPKVWCNPAAFKGLPTVLERSEKHFRWEINYSRRELEDIIRNKSGEDIGTLLNIVPLQRGVSGRLMEIEIQGTKRNLRIQRELNIRRVLSTSYLYSACFSIETEYGEDLRPLKFQFRGAGWGHGVGMCQVGAGIMASEGNSSQDILTHYYTGTQVEQVYGMEG